MRKIRAGDRVQLTKPGENNHRYIALYKKYGTVIEIGGLDLEPLAKVNFDNGIQESMYTWRFELVDDIQSWFHEKR